MDEAGFTEWVTGAERGLLRSAWLLTGDLHRSQDLVQEALVKVALRWRRLRDGNPTAHARTIIFRDAATWWRRRREHPVAEPAETGSVSADLEVSVVVTMALRQLTRAQRAVLARLGGRPPGSGADVGRSAEASSRWSW